MLSALLLSVSVEAHAQNTDGAATPAGGAGTESAIDVGRSALQAYAAGDWATAYQRFAEADKLAHSPVFVLYMARCKRHLGKLLDARELLRRVTAEDVSAAPAPWQNAVSSAHADLGTLQQLVPSIWLKVPGAKPTVSARVDGREVKGIDPGIEVELDPGQHVVEVVDDSGVRHEQTFEIFEGRRRVPITVELEQDTDEAAAPVGPGAEPRLAPAAESDSWSARRVFGYSALGLGAVGLGLGAVAGVIAAGKTSDLKDRCSRTGEGAGYVCDRKYAGDAESASDWAAVSTVSFIFGASAVAAGASVLLVVPAVMGEGGAGIMARGQF